MSSWVQDGAWLTELSTCNIGVAPNEERESTLSQILEANVPEKYFLSPKACEGILRRANKRGKKLPEILQKVLEQQIARTAIQEEVSATLGTAQDQYLFQPVISIDRYNQECDEKVAPTLKSINGGDDIHAVMVENHPNDSRVDIDESGNCQTLTQRMGTGGGNVPLVMCSKVIGVDLYNQCTTGMVAKTLKNTDNQTEYIVRRLTPTECQRLQGFEDGWGEIDYKEDFTDDEYAFWLDVRNTFAEINGKQVKDYTKEQMLKWYNKLHTDSAEYKMWGNGIGLPNALYVMEGIMRLNTQKGG